MNTPSFAGAIDLSSLGAKKAPVRSADSPVIDVTTDGFESLVLKASETIPIIIDVWATWCAPCREEIPGFIQFQERFRADGVQFVGVAIDQKERVAPYAKEMGINYPLVVGGLETMEFARQLGNQRSVLPFTLVIDRSGKVTSAQVGMLRPEKLESLLKPLL